MESNQSLQSEFKPANALRSVPKNIPFKKLLPLAVIVIIVAAGIFSGLVFSSRNKNSKIAVSTAADEENLSPEQKQSFQSVTRDSAEGVVEKNDKFEETAQGQWKLIREGGESQTAYLTSSFLDLDQFIGKKVKVFGETLGTDKVGWLMDVAKVEEL
ncbi:MAG: hypothetical protein Q8P25_02725 [Candidatus Curtissbacteria bacterium]|nr:hypothetical protein [Candidatus Curtissbacteria bacterium]